MESRSRNLGEYLVLGILLGLLAVVGAILWLAMSHILGPVYRMLRLVETGGLWYFTGWGRYFFSMPWGANYEFWSLFRSSIPFGVFCAMLIGLIGYAAMERVKSRHINSFIGHDGPPGYREIMEKVAPIFPHNAFFLRFDLSAYPQDHGPAATPLTEVEFLRAAGAVSMSAEGIIVLDRDRARESLLARFGVSNTLRSLYAREAGDGRYTLSPRAEEHVAEVVGALPWYAAVLLYAAITRIEAMSDPDEATFLATVKRANEYMSDVWRAILREVDAEDSAGKEVVLGLYAGQQSDRPLVALADLLERKAERMQVVRDAREALCVLICGAPNREAIAELNRRVPVGPGNRKARAVIARILASHGYLFGVLAHALEETRGSGILPPNVFGWLRFVDRSLWRYLLYIGMSVPCAEAAGMFEHYGAEKKLGDAIDEPVVEDAPDAIVRECRKYVINLDETTSDFPIELMPKKESPENV